MSEPVLYLPLAPLFEPILRGLQSGGVMEPLSAETWTTINAPYRSAGNPDRHPSLSVCADSATQPGGFKDHATGQSGSFADLIRLGGPEAVIAVHSNGHETFLARFCRERRLSLETLVRRWGLDQVLWRPHPQAPYRPALRYRTRWDVDRLKYLDHAGQKYGFTKSRVAHAYWYGLDEVADLAGPVLYLVNGDPAVWVLQQCGFPAACLLGENVALKPHHIQELRDTCSAQGRTELAILYDRGEAHDRLGAGAQKLATQLRQAGFAVRVLLMPAKMGPKADADDLHRLVGDAGMAAALLTLDEAGAEDGGVIALATALAPTTGATGASATSPRPYDLLYSDEFIARPYPEPEPLIQGLLFMASTSLWTGRSKMGKSSILYALIVALIHTQTFLGRAVKKSKVALFPFEESPPFLKQRLQAMKMDVPDALLLHIGPTPDDPIAYLRALIGAHKPDVVMIDPLPLFLRLHQTEDRNAGNSYLPMYGQMLPFQEIAHQTGVHICLVMHEGKMTESPIGSTAFEAAVDAILRLELRDGQYSLSCEKHRYGNGLPRTIIELDTSTYKITNTETTQRRGAYERGIEILDYLGSETRSRPDTLKNVKGGHDDIARVIKDLEKAGAIAITGDGAPRRPHRYTQTDDGKKRWADFCRPALPDRKE
jgi:hypothetical protein